MPVAAAWLVEAYKALDLRYGQYRVYKASRARVGVLSKCHLRVLVDVVGQDIRTIPQLPHKPYQTLSNRELAPPVLLGQVREQHPPRIRLYRVQLGIDGVREITKVVPERLTKVLRSMPSPASRSPSFVCGDLSVDFSAQQVRVKGEPVELTSIEYKLLYHLVRNAGQVLRHETLLAKVWGREYVNEIEYLRVYVRRLRCKLEADPDHPHYILTERGLGYRFRSQE